jgi:hypothetical protein
VPAIKGAASHQHGLELAVGASSPENIPDFVVVVRQELQNEVKDQGLAEVELALVRYFYVPLILEVLRKLFEVVGDFGMQIGLARLRIEIGLIFAQATKVYESKASCRFSNLTGIAAPRDWLEMAMNDGEIIARIHDRRTGPLTVECNLSRADIDSN